MDSSKLSIPRSPMRQRLLTPTSMDSGDHKISDAEFETSFNSTNPEETRYVEFDKFMALKNHYDAKIDELNERTDGLQSENTEMADKIKELEKQLRLSR
jgi:uncharacterized phage infection (PIP) family protein YhgE